MFAKSLQIGMLLLALTAGFVLQNEPSRSPQPPDTQANPYRKTRFGWQDARNWLEPHEVTPQEQVPIHPLWVSVGLVLLVVGTMIWSSEEDEIAQILESVYDPPAEPPTDSAAKRD